MQYLKGHYTSAAVSSTVFCGSMHQRFVCRFYKYCALKCQKYAEHDTDIAACNICAEVSRGSRELLFQNRYKKVNMAPRFSNQGSLLNSRCSV